MVCGIYLIENIQTHQLYVGQSVNVKERWRHHRDNPNGYSYIDNAIQKYGPENFSLRMLTELPKNSILLDQHEKYWIDFYNTFHNPFHYNLTIGGQGMGCGEDHPCFKGYYRLRKGQFHPNGKQDYKLVNPKGEVLKHSVDKDYLLGIIRELEEGSIMEDDLFKNDYVIVKHGFVCGKQRYALKAPDGSFVMHSVCLDKLVELKRCYNES